MSQELVETKPVIKQEQILDLSFSPWLQQDCDIAPFLSQSDLKQSVIAVGVETQKFSNYN